MKHLKSLMQRKHNEFDGGRDAHRISSSHHIIRAALQPKDGYDWLQQINESQRRRAQSRRVQGHWVKVG